jgi:hypothetical protein
VFKLTKKHMKRTFILLAAFLLAATVSHAQTEKGNQTLGLNLGFSYANGSGISINPSDGSTSNTGYKTTTFSIGPAYSYFVADKLDLGASLSYGTSTSNYPPTVNNESKQSSYGLGGTVYLRKYFMFKDKIGIRTGPYVGYEKSDYKSVYTGANALFSEDSKTDDYSAGVRMELVYFPSKSLGFSANIASLNYDHSKTDSGTQGNTSSDNVGFGFVNNGLTLSVFYVFGK